MLVQIYIYIYISIYIYILNMYVLYLVCMCACAHVCMYACMHVRMYAPWGPSTPDSDIGWATQRRKTNPTPKFNARRPYLIPNGSNSTPEGRSNAKQKRPCLSALNQPFRHWICDWATNPWSNTERNIPACALSYQVTFSITPSFALSLFVSFLFLYSYMYMYIYNIYI